jgi:hypothetical protein
MDNKLKLYVNQIEFLDTQGQSVSVIEIDTNGIKIPNNNFNDK